jgi:hypothetical protein
VVRVKTCCQDLALLEAHQRLDFAYRFPFPKLVPVI